MALFPEWLLRSVRRENVTDSPILAIERLGSLDQPLDEADKEILVGAVLTMSSSLHLALGMLQGVLPQEKSQDRLGEVLCPTLGHLLAAVQSTLSSFQQACPQQTAGAPRTPPSVVKDTTSQSPRANQPTFVKDHQQMPSRRPATRPTNSSAVTTPPRQLESWAKTEKFPRLEDRGTTRHVHVEVDIHSRPESHLVKALQAEMRVQAAIHVAIESLEFAEGQLKVVKEVNQLHEGDFGPIQKHFYEGYNRLLFRALELQRREIGSPPDREGLISAPISQQPYPQPNGHRVIQASPKQQPSISFQSTSPAQSRATTPRAGSTVHATCPERRHLTRRNTIQGISQEDPRSLRARPPLKRRLSLAEELAMVGEDSESGCQDEASEVASSASEMEESDTESCNDSRGMMSGGGESEGYSTNGESAGEESAIDSEDDGDSGDKTLDALDIGGLNHASGLSTTNIGSRSRSRLPRLQPLRG